MNKKSMTLQAWSRQWLELYVKPVAKPSGYEHYRDNLEKHILPCLGRCSLERLTTPVVQAFLNQMGECGNLRTGGPLSSKSVKNIRVVLDVCCKRAVADGHMKENPVPATVCRRCPSRTVEVLSDEQQKVLEGWLFQNLTLYSAGILLALYSGMRLGECCALRWSCYDSARGELHIRETVRRVTEGFCQAQGKENPSGLFGTENQLLPPDPGFARYSSGSSGFSIPALYRYLRTGSGQRGLYPL